MFFPYFCFFLFVFGEGINGENPKDTSPIIGFDCNQTEPEVLAVSTLEIGPCPEISTFSPDTQTVYGQIIQKHTMDYIKIRTCQLTKSTFYFKCGSNWYNYQIYPPSVGVLIPISSEKCSNTHLTGFYKWSATREEWGSLIPNNTYHFSSNEIGWTDSKGYCEGGTVELGGTTHNGAVVQSSSTFSIRESYGVVDHETGTINIEGTLSCTFSKGSCTDAKTGTHVWTPLPKKCPEDDYKLIYQGLVNITSSSTDSRVLITINNPPFLFTSEMGITSYTCGLSMIMTEFPGIYVLKQQNGAYQTKLDEPGTLDVKFLTYLNAKLTFTYHNLMDSARDMYLSAMHETCKIEREMLKNRIEIIRLNSAAGGLSSLLKEGMFAKTNGEVIHLIKCEPVAVTFRNSDICYDSLPITYKDQAMFLLPNTHIISPYSNVIECSPITPLTYRIGSLWWAYTGTFQQSPVPSVLKPQTEIMKGFTKIKSFSKGGMYSESQVEAIQKMLVFPSLRESITTDLVTGVTKFSTRPISFDLTSIMSDADWKSMARKQVEQVWGYFSSVGNAVSGFIGIYFIYKLIKSFITCFIDGHEIYKVFGCSLYLLTAFWSRLAMFFIRRGNVSQEQQTTPPSTSAEVSLMSAEQDQMLTEFKEVVEYRPVFPPKRQAPTAPLASMTSV
nr:MAG: putative glycoprotein [Wufeng shrew chuvirus 2]